MIPLVAAAGFRWIATDEEILAKTIRREFSRDGYGQIDQPELLYRPYRVGQEGRQVVCGFRDHVVSDLIGFSYASWPAESAAEDFVQRLTDAGRRYTSRTSGGDATIFVILDGENAWEHFEDQGRPFLRALYRRLASHPELKTVTMGEACTAPKDTLPSIFPGSWINADFYIWIGHPDDHRGWSQLADARRALDSASGVSEDARKRAWEEMLIAEGSDWFWWYGDDHSSDHDRTFDELFRRHVINIYRALGKAVPEELLLSNITTQAYPVDVYPPTGFIRPVIDGELTNYFEWVGAGGVEVPSVGDAMHEVTERTASITLIEFGFDLEYLYVKVAGNTALSELLSEGQQLSLNFLTPGGVRLTVSGHGGTPQVRMLERAADGQAVARICPDIQAAAGRVLELRVPFRCLGATTHNAVRFIVALSRNGLEIEHYPRQRPIEFEVPDEQFPSRNWTA
jgi:hypothetical protein